MAVVDRRFTRQTRLKEVGVAGQARLAAAEVPLGTRGVAAELERRYLEGAGARIAGDALAPAPTPHALPFEVEDPAARDVALGAHAALATLRRVWLGS